MSKYELTFGLPTSPKDLCTRRLSLSRARALSLSLSLALFPRALSLFLSGSGTQAWPHTLAWLEAPSRSRTRPHLLRPERAEPAESYSVINRSSVLASYQAEGLDLDRFNAAESAETQKPRLAKSPTQGLSLTNPRLSYSMVRRSTTKILTRQKSVWRGTSA